MVNQTQKKLSDKIAREFAAEIRQQIGSKIKKIILYGSRARGNFWEWSDFDFVIIIEPCGEDLYSLDNKIMDIAGEIFCHYNMIISAQVLGAEDWNSEKNSPWGINVLDEGIIL
jgi:predicted nucleotidyltransferase